MANKMLIDATHPEETRVVVLRGNRVEEFDFESAHRKQLRGNIYLAKVTRVEPSLQAAFVDYGGNRHGFLAFSEIHPDYYQIPIADRQALIDEEERAQRDAEDEADRRSRRHHRGGRRRSAASRDDEIVRSELAEVPADDAIAADEMAATPAGDEGSATGPEADAAAEIMQDAAGEPPEPLADEASPRAVQPVEASAAETAEIATALSEASESDGTVETDETAAAAGNEGNGAREAVESDNGGEDGDEDEAAEEIVESVGGADALEEVPDRAPRYRRQYKIQEVIKRRQIMLVQVVKEERGTKGAALTTYLSLAGRYSVLMPNTARGGGISRKITSARRPQAPQGDRAGARGARRHGPDHAHRRRQPHQDRDQARLRISAAAVGDRARSDAAIQAPSLVYEEGILVKRSIRDLYNKDIDEVIVAGDEAPTRRRRTSCAC